MSNTTINSALESLPSWYASGVLKLHGFVFNDQHNIMDFLVFKTSAASRIAGYIEDQQKVFYFNQSPVGDFVFGSRVCQFESWPAVNQFNLSHFNAIYLPKLPRTGSSQSILPAAGAGDPQSAVVTFVIPVQDFEARHNTFDAGCRVLDTARGSLTEVDVKELLASEPEHPCGSGKALKTCKLASSMTKRSRFLDSVDHMVAAFAKATVRLAVHQSGHYGQGTVFVCGCD